MFFLPIALLTCAFYLAICAILDLAIFVAGYFGWLGMIGAKGWTPFLIFFGSIWLVSFYGSMKLFMAMMRARMPH